jgi:hypothetical protein
MTCQGLGDSAKIYDRWIKENKHSVAMSSGQTLHHASHACKDLFYN